MPKSLRAVCLAGMFLSYACACGFAQEIHFLSGIIDDKKSDGSYTWRVSYHQKLYKYLHWSFSWINEGHMPTHHRDGPSLQLWAEKKFFNSRLSLSAGAGPYAFFDTEIAKHGRRFKDAHGWGTVLSVAATWDVSPRWLLRVQGDRIAAYNSIDTASFMMGVGYRLEALSDVKKEESAVCQSVTGNEITGFLGKTVVNSNASQESQAWGAEYRRGLFKYLDATVGWIHEGDAQLIRRDGAVAQLWPTKSFFDDKISLSTGLGVYAAMDRHHRPSGDEAGMAFFAPLISMSVAYHLSERFLIRAVWHRTLTNYNRDTDVMLAGAGVRF